MSDNITPQGVLSFPHLFTPKPPAPNAEPRYSMVLVFTPEQQETAEYKAMAKAAADAAREKWAANMPRGLRSPIRDCSEKDHFASFPEGSTFVSFWSKDKPTVVDANVQTINVPGDVFAGQRARASYRPFAYDNSGNKGVSFYLNNVQICKADEDRLDGRKAASAEFGKVAGGTTAPDAAGAADNDENPFG